MRFQTALELRPAYSNPPVENRPLADLTAKYVPQRRAGDAHPVCGGLAPYLAVETSEGLTPTPRLRCVTDCHADGE
jgi:hypothetical protein